VVKEYNYIYTGANTDIIKFEIKYNTGFSYEMAADGLQRTQDSVKETSQGGSRDKEKETVNPHTRRAIANTRNYINGCKIYKNSNWN